MKDLYLVYLKDKNDIFSKERKFSRAFMFDISDLRAFVYKINNKYGMPKAVDNNFVWFEKQKEICHISAYLGNDSVNINNLLEGRK